MKLKDLFKKIETANEVREMYDNKDNFKYCVEFVYGKGREKGTFCNYEDMCDWFKEIFINPISEFIEDKEIEIDKLQEFELNGNIGTWTFKYYVRIDEIRKGE